MKKTINGHRYSTETGTVICHCPDGTLFRKYNANEFFLYDRKDIIPVSWNEAKRIIWNYGERDFYMQFFRGEKSDKVKLFPLTDTDYINLREISGVRKITMQEALTLALAKERRNLDRHIREK